MKQKLTLIFLFIAIVGCASAQTTTSKYSSVKKGNLFGIHITALDVFTPERFKNTDSKKILTDLRKMDIGMAISYWKGLTKGIDFSLKAGFSLDDFASAASNRTTTRNENQFAVELEPSLNFRPYRDNSLIAPFLTVGIGGGRYSQDYGAYVPAGVGIQVNLKSSTYILIQSQYRFALTKDVLKDAIGYSVGIAQNFSRSKPVVMAPPPPPVVLDRDGDGVLDADDKCPDVAGLPALQGCPDRDGDGIADIDDKCPDVAGIAKYQGCPIPDTDGDGVNDELDKCPTVKGLARYQGCPIPDTDGDGVNDEEDKCPTRVGPASNQGCPVIAKEVIEKINFAAKNVFFSTGSFKLLPKSFKSLDEVVKLLKDDETLMIDIDGHTDAQGSDESNQVLSDNRASAVKNYLVSKGISETRLKSAGYGETKPVADNTTAAGRAKNRRTEMTVKNF